MSEPCTFRIEEQQGEWLAACIRKGAPVKEGSTIAWGNTVDAAVVALVRKLKRKATP